MQFILDEGAGCCFGVERAIKMAGKESQDASGPIVTIGPLIHNPQVIEEMKRDGVAVAEEGENLHDTTAIIRTHGVRPQEETRLRKAGNRVLDATCPYVKKSHECADLLRQEDYHIIVIGDPDHPEIKGVLGYSGERVTVITQPEEADSLPHYARVGVVVQTTYPIEKVQKVISKLVGRSTELRVFNTICDYTSDRQISAREISSQVDLMYVIGGRNSANTNKLAEICKQQGTVTRHIEVAEEIEARDLEGVERVGITAGASTPDGRIASVIDRIEELSGALKTTHS
jgi:4-hydroxy-3-methylbut-2-enyl diphosphate reductase